MFSTLLGVQTDVWIDLKAEIELRGYTVHEFVDMLKSTRCWWNVRQPETKRIDNFYEWNW